MNHLTAKQDSPTTLTLKGFWVLPIKNICNINKHPNNWLLCHEREASKSTFSGESSVVLKKL